MEISAKKLLRMTLLERTNKALYHVGMALVYLSGHPLIDLVDAAKRNLALTHRLLESYRILYLKGQPKEHLQVKKLLANMETTVALPEARIESRLEGHEE